MPLVENIANCAQDRARQLGITKFDIYGSSVEETSAEVDGGKAKQVQASSRSSAIVRVWNADNRVGVASTTDTDSNGIELALKTAQEASSFGVGEHAPDFSPEAQAAVAEIDCEAVIPASVPTLVEKLAAAETALLEAHPAIVGVPYNGIEQRQLERFYLNSEGAIRQESRAAASIYLSSKTEQPGKKPRSAGSLKISPSLAQLDSEGCWREVAEKTISHLDYQPIPSGKYLVIFSPKAFLSLLGAFSNLFNAQSILDRQSLSTPESLGTAIASPRLSLFDDALHPANIAPETFDGEGTPTRRVSLISKGILTNFLHSAGTAKRLNALPTGHANIGAKVTVSPHFYHVLPGEAPAAAYSLAQVEDAILIDQLQALHAGVNALQGSFSLPFDGWRVRGGELTSIESATVAGDFRDLLKSIVFVEKEAEITPRGVCPPIWVEGLSVTGE
jgi:PmbA protein